MIISHRYKFIFVKTLKTAGSSIEVMLEGKCDAGDVIPRIHPRIPGHEARNDSYFKFCVDRNPWDKSLSHFNMFKNADWHKRYDPDLTFEKYLSNGIFCHNAPFYCDLDGTVLVDKILRYDDLENQLREVMGTLGIEFDQLPNAKGDLRVDRAHYSEVMSKDQAGILEKAFAQEIDLMGWNF